MINNFELVKRYSNLIIKDLREILNEFHQINFSIDQWDILIRIWTHRTISLLLNKFSKIDKAFRENDICSVTVYENNINDLVNLETEDISKNSDNLYLNNIIFDEIINFKNIKVKKNYIKKNYEYKKNTNFNFFYFFKSKIKDYLNIINKKKIKRAQGMLFETYLSNYENNKLLKYYNSSKIYINKNLKIKKNVDLNLRNNLKKKINNSIDDEFYKFIVNMIFKIFPSCYLENFKDLFKEYNKLILPERPKFIYTANAYDTNEFFKLYLALSRSNIKYFVGQHGGATPIYRYGVGDTYIFNQVDGFFNWGWRNDAKNFQSFLFPKLNKKKSEKKNKISLMLRPHMRLTETWDKYQESLSMFKKDVDFLNMCKVYKFYEKLYLRAYPNYICKINNFKNWRKYIDIKKFDIKHINFEKYINECDLNIFTYKSTGFFQLININKPTIILFREFDLFIKDEYQSFFNELAEVGIIHYENKTLINHLNKISNDIHDWWFLPSVQKKIKKFKDNFARDSNDIELIISKISI